MTSPQRIIIERSPASLPEHSELRRAPRNPGRRRPDEFYAAFDERQIFYDVFWNHSEDRILAVGPAPRNIRRSIGAARVHALPSREQLKTSLHISLSTMVAEWKGIPAGTTEIEVEIGGHTFTLKVQPNLSHQFVDRRVLFTMNKNNDLAWIEEWAHWHVKLHGTDTIFLFDNGSDRYATDDIAAVLSQIDGLRSYAVIDFPHKFGPIDPAVTFDPYWARFAQISSMSIVLRRLAASAHGLLNLDIDELANAPGGHSLYDLVRETRHGLLILPGRWVEPDIRQDGGKTGAHGQFNLVHRDRKVRESSPVKWILDPGRRWISNLKAHPYWHWVHKRPLLGKAFMPGAFFWHFKGINTGWKLKDRAASRYADFELRVDPALMAGRELYAARSRGA